MVSENIWDGVTRRGTFSDEVARARDAVADAAKAYDWPRLFAVLSDSPAMVNATRVGGASLYAPLHQVAHGGAPVDVAERLIRMSAWRTLQNTRGERPVDVAERRGHPQLLDVLAPAYKRRVPPGVLLKIQSHFHAVIRGRAAAQVERHALRLPELEPLLELDEPQMWFPVPDMLGGFKYWLEVAGVDAKLVTESWCRAVEGSGQRHEVTSDGSRLVDEGFV